VEPFRSTPHPKNMWRNVLLVLVLASVLAGCSLGGGSGAGSNRSASSTQSVTLEPNDVGAVALSKQVERMRIPTRNLPPLTKVVCQLSGGFATCSGTEQTGRRVSAKFRIRDSGTITTLVPVCSTNGNVMLPRNIFCAD
jgi:hypothetical protein